MLETDTVHCHLMFLSCLTWSYIIVSDQVSFFGFFWHNVIREQTYWVSVRSVSQWTTMDPITCFFATSTSLSTSSSYNKEPLCSFSRPRSLPISDSQYHPFQIAEIRTTYTLASWPKWSHLDHVCHWLAKYVGGPFVHASVSLDIPLHGICPTGSRSLLCQKI